MNINPNQLSGRLTANNAEFALAMHVRQATWAKECSKNKELSNARYWATRARKSWQSYLDSLAS